MLLHKLKLGFISGFTIAIIFMVISYLISPQNTMGSLVFKSLIAGTIGGLLTPFSITKIFKNGLGITSQNEFEWTENETIIHHSGAVYLTTQKKIAGELHLSENRLVFLSNALEPTATQIITLRTEILKTDTFNPIGNATEGLEITTKKQEHLRFIVDDASLWQSIIGKSSSVN